MFIPIDVALSNLRRVLSTSAIAAFVSPDVRRVVDCFDKLSKHARRTVDDLIAAQFCPSADATCSPGPRTQSA